MSDDFSDDALRFRGVSFAYRRRTAVFSDLDLAFKTTATVVLGPNGSGKSTLFALGASAYRPDRGTIELPGLADVRRLRLFRANVSWLPQDQQFVPGLTAREQVAYVGWLKGLGRSEAWRRAGGALDRVNLTKPRGRRRGSSPAASSVGSRSPRALVHDAQVLLLDEPTAGLDPAQRASFRDVVAEVAAERAVVVSTHDTQDIAGLYQQVVVLIDGRVQWNGTAADFLAQARRGPRTDARLRGPTAR